MSDARPLSKAPNGQKYSQWLGQQPQGQNAFPSSQQRQQQSTPPPVANYTLPGVINYLTSEFTNLERFKIMTNLERSEMKYKIVELEGQVNSLKYINEHQKVRIAELEQKIKNTLEAPGSNNALPKVDKIPYVDLDFIRDARNQLTSSMREVVQLLKSPAPSNASYLNLPDPGEGENEFEELFDNDNELSGKLDDFTFAEKPTQKPKLSVFAHYLEDIPIKKPQDQPKPQESRNKEAYNEMNGKQKSSASDVSHKPEQESDTETVILDDEPLDMNDEQARVLKRTQSVQIPKSAKSFFCDIHECVVSTMNVNGSQTINITTIDDDPTLSVNISQLESSVIDIFCIDTSPYRLLLVLDSGLVKVITLDELGVLDTVTYNGIMDDYNRVFSSDMAVRQGSVLLAINGVLKASLPMLNIYSLEEKSVTREKSFDREYFTTIRANASHSFEAVHWVGEENTLVFKLGASVVKLDLNPCSYKQLVHSENLAYGVHVRNYFDKNIILVPEYSEKRLQVRVYDCDKEETTGKMLKFNVGESPESLQLAVVATKEDFAIYKMHDHRLEVYDSKLELISYTTADGTLRRIGGRVVVTGDNFNFYDIE